MNCLIRNHYLERVSALGFKGTAFSRSGHSDAVFCLVTNIRRYHGVLKMEKQMETTEMTSEQTAIPSEYKGLGSAMAAELMIGF